MPIAELIAALGRDAAQQAAELVERAGREANELMAAVRARITEQQAQELAARENTVRAGAQRELADGRRHAQEEWLAARADLIARVLARAAELLVEVRNRREYHELLTRELPAALEFVAGECMVVCSPELVSVLQPLVADRAGVELCADPAIGTGFCVRTRDGLMEVTVTLEAELVRRAAELAIEIAPELEH